MKYVRTKSGDFPIAYEMDAPENDASIVFYNRTRYQDGDKAYLSHPRRLSFRMERKYIIKEADSIEELADYLLFKFKAEKKMIGMEIEETAPLSILKSFMEDGSLDFARLFIFKGKDLKCVSEMNETGKWELL